MRRVFVSPPSRIARIELRRRQKAVRTKESARTSWDRYRASAKCRDVVRVLKEAAGPRSRCFYCSDSLAGDIDHFLPIAVDFSFTFVWTNFAWICTICNRHKTNKFPRDESGTPLLINPMQEDPWKYFILDTDTGVIAPRYRDHGFDAKAEATLNVIRPLTFEAGEEGRKRVIDRLRTAASIVAAEGAPKKDIAESVKSLLAEVRKDDHGVAAWFGIWDGRDEPEFSALRARNAAAWHRFAAYCHTVRYTTP